MKLEKLVVGVIGLGMGRAHLEGAVKYGAEIGLICDLKQDLYGVCDNGEIFLFF